MNSRLFVAMMAMATLAVSAIAQSPTIKPAESKEAILAGFEKGETNAFEGLERLSLVTDHATQGQTAGKIALDTKGFGMGFSFGRGQNLGGSWSKYDRLIVQSQVDWL